MHKSLFYQLPICNLFTQHVIYLHGETPLVNYGSRSCISFIAKQQSTNTLFIYCSLLYCKHCFPHHTFNPLWSAKPVGLTTSLFSWGKVSFVLCAGSMLPTSHSLTNKFNGAVVEERQKQHLQKRLPSPPGSINLGFILRENLLLCSSSP